jgi:hypothetical protein
VTADAPATFVWISPEAPGAAELRALSSWAQAHGLTLVMPRDERPAAVAVDPAQAEPVEELLDRARDAIAARDGEGVERATAAAEALLRAHPELPQAAWLMAEVERTRATRWRRVPPEDVEAAERAWIRAEALDGGRTPGIGEVGSAAHPAAAAVSLALPETDEATLDGHALANTPPGPAEAARAAPRVISTVAGPHALVVTADGAAVWAGWIEVASGSSRVEVDAAAAVPCSTADMARAVRAASTGAQSAVSAHRVTCRSWIAVAAGREPGSVRVARCDGDRCGAAVDWPSAPAWARAKPDAPAAGDGRAHAPRWPAWASWALAGAGVALAAGAAVVASGAFQPAPTATRFVTGGLKSQ